MLEYIVGLADSLMVAQVGEAAVSGVSLVDFIMALLISLFAALATGGTVVAGQYLGAKENDRAKETVNQLMKFALWSSIAIMALIYVLRPLILKYLFGAIEADVENAANEYFMIIVLSVPFIALYNSGTAINLGLSVVIARCIGADDIGQAKYYTKKIIKIIYAGFVLSSIIMLSLMPLPYYTFVCVCAGIENGDAWHLGSHVRGLDCKGSDLYNTL